MNYIGGYVEIMENLYDGELENFPCACFEELCDNSWSAHYPLALLEIM